MNAPWTVPLNLPQVNLTAELAKSQLSTALTNDPNTDLKQLILEAAAQIGLDGNGREGMLGYLKYAASTFPKQYMALLSKVVPLQIDSKSTINVIEHVNIVSVPSDRYMPSPTSSSPTPASPLTIDHDSSPHIQTIEDMLNNPTPVDLRSFASADNPNDDEVSSD